MKDSFHQSYSSSLSNYPFSSQQEHDSLLGNQEMVLIDTIELLDRPISVRQLSTTGISSSSRSTTRSITRSTTRTTSRPTSTTTRPTYTYTPSPVLPVIQPVSLSHNGLLLLSLNSLNLSHSTIYGLIGRNGIGKSTLLRHLQTLPGVFYMPQEEIRECGCIPVYSDILSYLNGVFDSTNEIIQLMETFNLSNHSLSICTCKVSVVGSSSGLSSTGSRSRNSSRTNTGNNSTSGTRTNTSSISKIPSTPTTSKTTPSTSITPIFNTIAKSSLSGGERRKLHLIISFLIGSPLLLLDEPTNMLDLEGIVQLIKLLNNIRETTIIIVSHDIYFLDSTVQYILEIKEQQLYKYKGNYSNYCRNKQLKEKTVQREMELIMEQKERLKEMRSKYGVRKSRMVQSREKQFTNLMQQSGINTFNFNKNNSGSNSGSSSNLGSHAGIKDGMLTNMLRNSNGVKRNSTVTIEGLNIWTTTDCNRMNNSNSNNNLTHKNNLNNNESNNSTHNLNNNSSTTANTTPRLLIQNININLKSKNKILVIGSNGLGKSTFLHRLYQLLVNRDVTFEEQGLVRTNRILKILLVAQDHKQNFSQTDRVIPYLYRRYQEIIHGSNSSIREGDPSKSTSTDLSTSLISSDNKYIFDESMADRPLVNRIRQALSFFSLQKDYHRINDLSGGEKTKILLVLLIISSPDILLLDEISNNLDIETIVMVKEIIREFDGMVVAISHDKYLSEVFDTIYRLKDKRLEYYGKKI